MNSTIDQILLNPNAYLSILDKVISNTDNPTNELTDLLKYLLDNYIFPSQKLLINDEGHLEYNYEKIANQSIHGLLTTGMSDQFTSLTISSSNEKKTELLREINIILNHPEKIEDFVNCWNCWRISQIINRILELMKTLSLSQKQIDFLGTISIEKIPTFTHLYLKQVINIK